MIDVAETHLSPPSAIQLFDEVRGEYVWNVRHGFEAILTVEFGLPHLDVREPRPSSIRPDTSPEVARLYRRRLITLHGQWNLFVADGLWRVQADGLDCARHDTDLSKVEMCLTQLSGQKLTAVTWEPDKKVWRFGFDLGGIITITADPVIDSSSGDEWIFYQEGRSTLACVRDDNLTLEAASNAQVPNDRDPQL